MQKSIFINDVQVPIIKEGGEIWYPISYVFDKVIEVNTSKAQLIKNEELRLLIKKYNVDYGYYTGGIQEVYCIEEQGLKIYLTRYLKINRYNADKRKMINGLLQYLGLELLPVYEQFINEFDYKDKYNVFIEDSINTILKENSNIRWQKCSECGNYYPLHECFFVANPDCASGFITKCKDCQKWSNTRAKLRISHPDAWMNRIYRDYDEEVFIMYKNHDVIDIYQHYLKENSQTLPTMINNKKDILIIIKWLWGNKKIEMNQLNEKSLRMDFNFYVSPIRLTQRDIYTSLFKDDWKLYPWRFPNIKLPENLSIFEKVGVFKNYTNEMKIEIEDIYGFDYQDVINKCGLKCNVAGDLLGFVMELYDNQYGAYKFKINGVNYFKKKENRIQALKYYIEKDMKIDINKIPLYLTKMGLQRNSKTLYYLLYNGKYYKNLWEWVNECYPNKFVEADFVINSYRDEFDSQEEMEINDLLHIYYECVIYNQRNTERTIKINGMIPDWVVFLHDRCLLIEYFGLWQDRIELTSKRNLDYMEKTKGKINKYKELTNYSFLDLYPRDLDNNFDGVKNKIYNYLESN